MVGRGPVLEPAIRIVLEVTDGIRGVDPCVNGTYRCRMVVIGPMEESRRVEQIYRLAEHVIG